MPGVPAAKMLLGERVVTIKGEGVMVEEAHEVLDAMVSSLESTPPSSSSESRATFLPKQLESNDGAKIEGRIPRRIPRLGRLSSNLKKVDSVILKKSTHNILHNDLSPLHLNVELYRPCTALHLERVATL